MPYVPENLQGDAGLLQPAHFVIAIKELHWKIMRDNIMSVSIIASPQLPRRPFRCVAPCVHVRERFCAPGAFPGDTASGRRLSPGRIESGGTLHNGRQTSYDATLVWRNHGTNTLSCNLRHFRCADGRPDRMRQNEHASARCGRIEITVRVAPICSREDANRLALRQAAVETIKAGFENFIVINTGGGDYISGYTPVTAHTTLYGNSATTTVSGGAPHVAHRRVLAIQMFHAGGSGSEAALSAHAVLGSDWQTIVTKGAPNTCFGEDG